MDKIQLMTDLQSEPMELESGEINLLSVCRLCANTSDKMIGIYAEEGILNDLAKKINEYLPIKLDENDTLPLQCCLNCTSTLLSYHDLLLSCVETEKRLREIQEEDKSDAEDLGDVDLDPEADPEPMTSQEAESKLGIILLESHVKLERDEAVTPEARKNVPQDSNDTAPNMNVNTRVLKSDEQKRKFTCENCNFSFSRLIDLKKHKKTHLENKNPENYTCDICFQAFETESILNSHKLAKHLPLRRTRRAVKSKSSETYNDLDELEEKTNAKKKIKHSNKGEKRKQNSELLQKCCILDDEKKKRYKCPQCDYVFKYPSTFLSHQTVHTGEKAFCCHICGKNFRISSGLKHHINEFHLKIKNFPCEVCGMKFTAKAFRNEHMNIHTNNRPYVCDVCGKAFKQSGSLYVHKMFHSNNFRFECEICGKKFRRATELKIHNRLHTGEKPYKCHLCESAFVDSKGLKMHVKIHDKSQVFVCNLCGNKFNQERYLKNHLRNHKIKGIIEPKVKKETNELK